MRTVTNNFLEAQKRPDARIKRSVQYKRRYWNEATLAFAWEGSWTDLPETQIVSVSPVAWALDTEQLNEFKVSNVTLVVDNSYFQWRRDNPAGFFKQDSGSPRFFYEPYFMKVRVRSGFYLNDDTNEVITVFSGVATEYNMDSDSKTCQITIQGLETLLLAKKAEGIATTVTAESLGTGNGVTVAFTTANPGVGGITLVSVAGITKVEGSDYTVSNLNSSSLGATVTFTAAPTAGQAVKATYFYWPQSLAFHAIVTLLLTAGGVSGGDQFVTPVTFSGDVINSQLYTSQSDWDAGTKTILDTASSPGDITPDYANASVRQAQTWSTTMSGWTNLSGSSITSDGTYLNAAASSSTTIYRSQTSIVGPWEMKFTFSTLGAQTVKFEFMMGSHDGVSEGRSGYRVDFANSGSFLLTKVAADGTLTTLATATYTADTSEHTLKVIRNGAGRFLVYYDSTLKIDVTDTTFTSSTYFLLRREQIFPTATVTKFRDFVTPVASFSSIWESAAIDMTSAPTAWSAMVINQTTDTISIAYETKTSTDNVTYESYAAISGGNVPTSGLKRYLKLRITIPIVTTVMKNPIVNDATVRWTTSGSVVTLPAFTGLSVYEAIQAIGQFCNYEFGFTPDEDFFFRPKTTGASVMTITESDYVSRIYGLMSGDDRVYGAVRVTYGTATRELTASGSEPSSPAARQIERRYDVDADSNIQIPATADIATSVARTLFNYLSKPRRRFKAVTKYLPQLDLSDVVVINLANNHPPRAWYLGEPAVNLGDDDVYLWGGPDQIVNSMSAKIVGARFDTEKANCEFELEEVV
jgi:hypothetical protein